MAGATWPEIVHHSLIDGVGLPLIVVEVVVDWLVEHQGQGHAVVDVVSAETVVIRHARAWLREADIW